MLFEKKMLAKRADNYPAIIWVDAKRGFNNAARFQKVIKHILYVSLWKLKHQYFFFKLLTNSYVPH